MDCAIILGVFGSIIIMVAAATLPRFEHRTKGASHPGELCR